MKGAVRKGGLFHKKAKGKAESFPKKRRMYIDKHKRRRYNIKQCFKIPVFCSV